MEAGLVVIGAQTAGLAAAAEARRRNAAMPITVVDRARQPAAATCGLPWLFRKDSAAMCLHSQEELARRYRLDLRMEHDVTGIDLSRRRIHCRCADGSSQSIPFHRLVVATGARPRIPPEIREGPSSNTFTLRGVAEAEALREFLSSRNPRRAAVLGAGQLGLEMADAFRRIGLEVILLEQADQLLPGVVPALAKSLQEAVAGQSVDFRPRTAVRAIRPAGAGIVLELGDGRLLPADLLFCAAGIQPNTEWLRDHPFRFTADGHLAVNLQAETHLAGIYAAGDCAAAPHLLHGGLTPAHSAVVAARTGRVAGVNAAGFHAEIPGILGAWCLQAFNREIASVGLTPDDAPAGWPVVCIEVDVPPRPPYMAGPGPMRLAGFFRTDTRALVGCQVIGGEGAAAALQPVPLLLQHRCGPGEILQTEFPYTPPLGPLWHPLQQLARVAEKTLP